MLDIVITHHNEPWYICKKQFLMLDVQRIVDWNKVHVILVNDGGNRLPEEELNRLSFPIRQIDIPQSGVSAARNAGMEAGSAPWIMFCDCDDCFSNIYALEDVMDVLRHPSEELYDMMWTKCWSETGRFVYEIPPERTFVFIHGKIYRRQFLLDEKIRFDESLTFNEDSCFNATIIARTTNQRIGEVTSHAPVYTWVRRGGSVTNRPGSKDAGSIGQLHRNMTVTEENRIHRPAEYPGMVTRTAYDTYYMIHGRQITDGCKKQICEEFAPWITERYDAYGDVDEETLKQIREISRYELMDCDDTYSDDPQDVTRWVLRVIKEYAEGRDEHDGQKKRCAVSAEKAV